MSEIKNIKIESEGDANHLDRSQLPEEVDDFDIESIEEIEEIEPVEEIKVDEAAALESAKNEAKKNYDRLLRVLAEFENFKKRTNREHVEFKKYANESLIKELLAVVDNLERAITSADSKSADVSSFLEGVELTLQEILKIFKRYHVTPIEAAGNPFDPCYHQAVMQAESADCPANTILQELQKGYLIHDRLLRPAMVVVSKSPDTANKA